MLLSPFTSEEETQPSDSANLPGCAWRQLTHRTTGDSGGWDGAHKPQLRDLVICDARVGGACARVSPAAAQQQFSLNVCVPGADQELAWVRLGTWCPG